MLTEWDLNSAGNIALTPLAWFEAADFYGLQIGLRLEILPEPDSGESRKAVQLSIEPEQALELARVLQTAAGHLLAQRAPDSTN